MAPEAMISVSEALSRILGDAEVLQPVRFTLAEALGRVLAEDVIADTAIPPFDNSAVDGFAVRAVDVADASAAHPIRLLITAETPAGALPSPPIQAGCCVRIMTGAAIPPNADAIVMVEDSRPVAPDEASAGARRVDILDAPRQGQYLRRAGEDIPLGARALRRGAVIRSAEVAMLATVGKLTVSAVRAPRVAIISTGDEVVPILPGVAPPPGKIRNSNLYALGALVTEAGAEVQSVAHVPDDQALTERAIMTAVECGADVIVTAGGVSVGDRDYVKPAIEKLGRLNLWKVAMKPGKPLAFGTIGSCLCFGLPGNPVSAMVTFELFVRPALRKLAGRSEAELVRPPIEATLTAPISHIVGREEYVRAATTFVNGRLLAHPISHQGSGVIHSMTLANSLVVVPTDSPDIGVGALVNVLLRDLG